MRVDACHYTVVKSPRTSTTTLNPDVSCGLRFVITCQSWLLAVTQVPHQRRGLISGDSGGEGGEWLLWERSVLSGHVFYKSEIGAEKSIRFLGNEILSKYTKERLEHNK